MWFWEKKKKTTRTWDRENRIPAVRSSICTGEKVFGFKDIHSDDFLEIALIRTEDDLRSAAADYGITDIDGIPTIY